MISMKEILNPQKKPKSSEDEEIELLDINQEEKEEKIGTIVINDIISSDIIDGIEEEQDEIQMNIKTKKPESNIQIKLEEKTAIKDVEVGKKQKNIMKKSSELTKIEITELVKQILKIKKLDLETKSLISRFTEKYIKYKYFFEGEFKDNYQKSELQETICEELQSLSQELERSKKFSQKNINKVKNAFMIINDIDFAETSLIKILKENTLQKSFLEKL